MQKPFEIAGHTINAGDREIIDIPLSRMSDHTQSSLSVLVIHGRKEGPVIFVSAAVHGDEVTGIEVVRRLACTKTLRRISGTLLLIPIVNSFGFISRDRYLPDRRDLNRSFPGSTNGSLTSRLAYLFLHEIVMRCELGIDLHSAALHRENLPQIRIDLENKKARELAEVFAAPVILGSSLRDGSMRQVASDYGVPVMVYEAGEALRFDEFSIKVGVSGVLRVMRHLGMISKAKGKAASKTPSLVSRKSTWLRAPEGGTLRTSCRTGTLVHEGDILGRVSDPFGEEETLVIATSPGLIIGRSNIPVVNQGDAIFHLATLSKAALNELTLEANDTGNSVVFDEDEIR